jgi:hypothetical protein
MATAAVSLTVVTGMPHKGNRVLQYSANVRQMMATLEGRMTMMEVQAYMKPMISPNASFR